MPGRPPKPVVVLKEEKKSHRTKEELQQREKSEKALLTGTPLKEWKEVRADPIAHKEFLRVKKLLKSIGKDDALHEGVINRYCTILSECKQFEDMKRTISEGIGKLQEMKDKKEIEPLIFLDELGKLQDRLFICDKKIMEKRKMLLQIERENIMTIAAALRAIPKTVEKTKQSKMASYMEKRGIGNAT
jgi:phage terminase small subunit